MSDAAILFLLVVVFGAVVAVFQSGSGAPSGHDLQRKFVSLGVLNGRTRTEIESVVGAASSFSAVGDGFLLQWMATGYHIALRFDVNGVCCGVTHEFAS